MAPEPIPPQDPWERDEDDESSPADIPLPQLLDALLDLDKPLHPVYLYRLSDLSQDDLDALGRTWPKIPDWRRQALMEDIGELGDTDFMLSFQALGRFALQDSSPQVRILAVRTLWEYESEDLIPVFLSMMEEDPAAEVRTAAASALGRFVYLGEIEELDEDTLRQIEDRLLKVTSGQDMVEVRRHALESLGYSAREEVNPLIEAAYYSGVNDWIVSALFAMGRSANEEWNPLVMSMLEHDVSQVRLEAARAAGELEISQAVPRLVDLLNEDDADVRSTAIWSLSQIGGEGVRDVLEQMYDNTEDEEEAELLEDALDNLSFTEDMEAFSLLDVDEEDEEDLEEDLDDELYDDFEDDEDLQD